MFKNFYTFWKPIFTKLTKLRASKLAKTAVLEFQAFSSLISREIWMTEKSWNYHTVEFHFTNNFNFVLQISIKPHDYQHSILPYSVPGHFIWSQPFGRRRKTFTKSAKSKWFSISRAFDDRTFRQWKYHKTFLFLNTFSHGCLHMEHCDVKCGCTCLAFCYDVNW